MARDNKIQIEPAWSCHPWKCLSWALNLAPGSISVCSMLMEQWNADLTSQGKCYLNHQVGVWQAAIQEFKPNESKSPCKRWVSEPRNTNALDTICSFFKPLKANSKFLSSWDSWIDKIFHLILLSAPLSVSDPILLPCSMKNIWLTVTPP